MLESVEALDGLKGSSSVEQPSAQIENHFTFVWFGSRLPAFATIAIRSALASNPGSTATLFHDDTLVPSVELLRLKQLGLRLERVDLELLLLQCRALSPTLDTVRLGQVYRSLKAPAAKSNVIRILVLFSRGGIYLDTDTLTIKDMTELRRHPAFCGEERILWPATKSRVNLKAITLGEVRRVCAAVPYAYRMNRRLLKYYSLAANNAVLGARPGHPFLLALLESMLRIPASRITKRFMLGTHLLQQELRSYHAENEEDRISVLAPDFFYPVGPMISRHYFGHYRDVASVASELISADTHVIHWYASVAALDKRDEAFVLANSDREVFSYLCRSFTQVSANMPRVPALESGSGFAPLYASR